MKLPIRKGDQVEITSLHGDKAVCNLTHNGDYFLRIVSRQTGHSRWGNKAEITADIAHFVDTGKLPVSSTQWGF